MKLGVMQPYFFPYTQQFRHIGQCDRWIVFDTPKFSRKTWESRNRIADRNTGWSYLSVPVAKGATSGSIGEAPLATEIDWRAGLLDKLRVYQASAPHYRETLDWIEQCIAPEMATLGELNTRILTQTCLRLGIETPIERLSDLSLDLPSSAGPGDWGLLISKAVGADRYSNAEGGQHLFDAEVYRRQGVELEFYQRRPLDYPTPGFPFTPDLSIIDAAMWMGWQALSAWCAG